MNQQATPNITLFDLLARSWQRPAAIRQILFNDDETALGVVTEDGAVAFARMADNEPPEARLVTDNGQTGIRPRSGRPAPLIMTRIKGASRVCRAEAGGFLVADDRHRLIRLSRAGEVADTILALDLPLEAFDRCQATGDIAVIAGGDLICREGGTGAAGSGLPLGQACPSRLAFSPDGARMALAGADQVEIRSRNGRDVLSRTALQADPTSLAWSSDGGWLAIGLAKGGMMLIETGSGRHAHLEGFPGPVRSLGFGGAAAALVAGGAYRIAGWSLATPPLEDPATGALASGRAGLTMVEAVALQPHGQLVAAGYANGQIVIAPLGSPDEMIVRVLGGPVTALAWTEDGRHLAVGDALGTVAIATFPPQLFKSST